MKKYLQFSALEKIDSRIARKVNKLNKSLDSFGELEVEGAGRAFLKNVKSQIKIRPRLRLLFKVLPILVIAFAATSAAVNFLEPKKGDIKINGEAVLVAQSNTDNTLNVDEVQISQSVRPKLSPFEFVMPVDGHISQGYRSYHRAFDIAAGLGSAIRPVGSGIVEHAGFMADGKGNVVIVDHGDELKTVYAHMGKIYVGVGNQVNTSTNIGTVGLTGRTTGPHVHFELYDNGVAVNPGNLLPQ